ncbi:unnamed protein product [Didymodactylos carnosus]|uniref:Nuclear receptor domain-containing protein n=2 Tax=Didymodactylos carnosus TaxID=1234261 RepID=A0A815EDI4_9BILA|nr:unnamed protein product [Didymodactylos carnosus]CAF4146846.1 unnamed protein product [Didymodactylos carnosus]
MCVVCLAPATGYNFDQITCESCKAFFRRNALKSSNVIKCRCNGVTDINVHNRKRCKACRLAKCFAKGMRKEWILTDDEKRTKKQKIEENRRLRQLQNCQTKTDEENIDNSAEEEEESVQNALSVQCDTCLISSQDWITLEKIQCAYAQSVKLNSLVGLPLYPSTRKLSTPAQMVNEPTNIHSTRLITYFKQLPEFCELEEDDKLTLIKHNLLGLVFIRATLIYKPANDTYQEYGTDDCIFDGKDLIECYGEQLYKKSTQIMCSFIDIVECDRLVVKIILIIMLFSKGYSTCTIEYPEPVLKNSTQVFQSQNIYVDLLWRYCEEKFGFFNTIKLLVRLITLCMAVESVAKETQQYVQSKLTADELAPLMQSVMHLS